MKYAYTVGMPDTGGKMFAYRGDAYLFMEKLSAMGYDGVEPFVRDAGQVDATRLEKQISRLNLEIAAIGTAPISTEDKLSLLDPAPEIREAAVGRAKRHIDLAARFGAGINIGKFRGQIPAGMEKQARQWLHDGFSDLCEYAQKKNVAVAVEPQNRSNLNNLNTTKETVEWIRKSGIPNLYLMLDTFHMHQEDPSIPAALIEAAPLNQHMHFADINRGVPGSGSIPFAEILRTLAALGYDGYISMEIAQQPDGETAAYRALNYLRAIGG